jgi:membrane associated rhomboid family serine protease
MKCHPEDHPGVQTRASGAISGVLGAYLLLHPQATVRALCILGIIPIVLRVPAIIVLGLWFVTQIANAPFSPMPEGGLAFTAHVGGFLAGMALVPFFRQASVGLFQSPHSRPFEIERKRGPWG